MPKTAYLYDELSGYFIDSFEVDERPEFTYPDMPKGVEFDDVISPEVGEDERARWDGTKYIVDQKYNTLRNATFTPGEEGKKWDGKTWN